MTADQPSAHRMSSDRLPEDTRVSPQASRPTLILSIDFEDWNQLVRRRVGAAGWDTRSGALARQTATLLDTLDALRVRATFFLLGLTARRYPELVQEIAAHGHELASHGFEHRRVYDGRCEDLRRDVQRSLDVIGDLTGRQPLGYRAPAFSINRNTPWAYEVLAELGFVYDSSQYDSPRIPDRLRPVPDAPFQLALSSGRTLWELPVAVWRLASRSLPIGGGAYWRVLPARVLLRGLASAASRGPGTLYLHPYECDPQPLRAGLDRRAARGKRAHVRLRELQRNPRRRKVLSHLHAVVHHFQLLTCEQAYAQLSGSSEKSQTAFPGERQVL
jgi:polysaccharide deacetylase family protein (PEP-CTERM system associated)